VIKRNLTSILQKHILQKQSRTNPSPEIYISKRFWKALVCELNLIQRVKDEILLMESHHRKGAVITISGCPIFIK